MLFSMKKNENKGFSYYAKDPFKPDESGITYRLGFSVCASPLCECGVLTLEFSLASQGQGFSPLMIVINVLEQSLVYKEMNKGVHKFAQQLKKVMSEADWEQLADIYNTQKIVVTEECDVNEVDVNFADCDYDYYSIDKGDLVFINQILPYTRQFNITVKGNDFIFVAACCLALHCHCQDCLMQVVPVSDSDKEIRPIGNITVDYKKEKISKAYFWDSKQVSLKEVKEELLNRYPEIYQYLRTMHSKMRAIYKVARKKYYFDADKYDYNYESPETFIRENKKIGRNEPCPCGSGKKYKKCCG